MSKSDLQFELVNISSSYDPESDYFTLQADMKPLSFENIFILYSKILSYQDNILINASDNTLMLFENKDDVCFIHDGIFENGNNNPNKFEVIYGVFDFIEKNTLNLKLSGPPELSRKGGSFIVHQPETNFIGSNKWKFGSISIKSIVIRKLEGSFEISFNLENKNFLTSIPIIEIKGKNWEQKTQPMLADNSKFQITIDIYEEIDSSDLDFNFMFFEAGKSERLSDQIVPTPEIEESNNDYDEIDVEVDLSEDKNKILTQDEINPNDDEEISIKNSKKSKTSADKNKDKISNLDTDNFFKHNILLVSIGKSLKENKKIYDAARFAWDAKKDRAEQMDYVIAHQSGKIIGVFKPEKWLFANDKEFADFPKADPKRIGFIGNVADSEILLEYLNKDIPSEYRPKGASNPVRYIELEKSNTQKEKKNKKVNVSSKKIKESKVKEFGWWNIHKGYDENDIDQYICEFYEIKDDLDENGEEIFDEDGYSSTQKDDGWGNLYNPKITMEMVMSIETFLQKYIDEYDGDFGETDMGSALKEWIAKYTSHVQHDPPWDYPDRNYKMWD